MYQVVGADGQVYGPVDTETLKQWTTEERFSQLSNLIDPISGRIFRAEDMPELRPLFFTAPPIAHQQVPPMAMPPTQTPEPQYPQQPYPQMQNPQVWMPDVQGPQYPPFPASPMGQAVVSATQVNVHPGSPEAGYQNPNQIPGPTPYSGVGAVPYGAQPPMPHIQVNNVVAVQNQQPYYQPHQPVPYATSAKSKVTAALLAFFLGTLGIHRFYLGHTTIGIIQLLMTVLSFLSPYPITAIWAIVDFIMILTGELKDVNGRPLAQ